MSESIIHSTGAMATEPARVVSIVIAVVASVIALLVAFGINLTEAQTVAILGFLTTVGPLVAGFVIRQRVYSPDSVKELVRHGVEVGAGLRIDGEGDSGATLA